MAQESAKPRKAQISYGAVLPDLQPLAPPYYSRTGTKTSTSPGSKKPVVVIVHQPSGPVKEPGSERPGYGGYYH
ncbi:hypothetical protein LTR29_002635 [Friedmanniomyces endolithicus]|uniref:Uncharacterized protein n=1 Tax=Friedmanniomyces endolithicus TaxID=329885 RepID=A0A4U0TSD5_9PEZI|nr:hypothetical protein LTS09_003252 [Friedmanniomyces endolithicus]KAK0945780.1 hypothetical protein LTR29_002635 [Friedmanniomyces endolithicus]TKA25017.1 hypothetical protein B0A54_17192 [Friedmanniomyces endolithicus]